MILVDTSGWIDVFRDTTLARRRVLELVTEENEIILTRFQQREILQGAREAKEWGLLDDCLAGQDDLEMSSSTWPSAARTYFDLRHRGPNGSKYHRLLYRTDRTRSRRRPPPPGSRLRDHRHDPPSPTTTPQVVVTARPWRRAVEGSLCFKFLHGRSQRRDRRPVRRMSPEAAGTSRVPLE